MNTKKNLKNKNRRCLMIVSSDSGSGDDDFHKTAAKRK